MPVESEAFLNFATRVAIAPILAPSYVEPTSALEGVVLVVTRYRAAPLVS